MDLTGIDDAVVRAVIKDGLDSFGGRIVARDVRALVIEAGGIFTCAVKSADDFVESAKARGITGTVRIVGAPADFCERIGHNAVAYKTFAYLRPLPPSLDRGIDIKRLAPTLAGVLSKEYRNAHGGFDEDEMREVLKSGSVFGLFEDSKLAGFIGEHLCGGMGMLTVFEAYKRRGYGEALEKFMINYVMSFGRTPTCDVEINNAPSLALQEKIGMTAAREYTFWLTDFD